MVVALDLEGDRLAVADVDHAGVLARPLQDPGALGGKVLQVLARALVGAVLAPHGAEDAELHQIRLAPQPLEDTLPLLVAQALRPRHFDRDLVVHGFDPCGRGTFRPKTAAATGPLLP